MTVPWSGTLGRRQLTPVPRDASAARSADAASMREDDIRPRPLLDEFFRHLKSDAERLAARRTEFVLVPCPACGDDVPRDAFEKDGFAYVECECCGSLYVSPRPSAPALADYAANSKAVEFWSTHFYRETAAARRARIFRPRASQAAELVKLGLAPQGGSFVDVGAGYGLFLQELQALGAFGRLLGIEPDPRLARNCEEAGFEVVRSVVEEIPPGTVQVDAAAAFEVLEHVFDPLGFLRACANLLRRQGVLTFTTLTISGFDLQVLWSESRSITPPQHLNFPSIRGIERLIERAGLQVVSMATPGRLDVDIVRNRLTAEPHLAVPRFARTIAEAGDETREAFQRFLAEHRLSSHLHCTVRKSA